MDEQVTPDQAARARRFLDREEPASPVKNDFQDYLAERRERLMEARKGKPSNLRSVRVDDKLWNDAKEVAAAQGITISDIVRTALDSLVNHYQAEIAKNDKRYDPADIDDALFILANPNFTNSAYPYGWLNADVWAAEDTVSKER